MYSFSSYVYILFSVIRFGGGEASVSEDNVERVRDSLVGNLKKSVVREQSKQRGKF